VARRRKMASEYDTQKQPGYFERVGGEYKAGAERIISGVKEGAGQIVIVGPANSGKSSLLNALTNANAKVAPYSFTTEIPQPAMMPYENILIQLVDTPPLIKSSPPWLKGILKAADGLLAIFDLSPENLVEDIESFRELLNNWGITDKKILFLGNKVDLEESKQNLKKIEPQYKIKIISCSEGTGIEELKKEIFDLLEIVRVYTKPSNKSSPDFEHPFIFKKNSRLIELTSQIHRDFFFSFKYAKLFKKNFKKPQFVGKDYILQDEDIIEIHI
ncbi:50S ribosome-binding GTPase, partial [Patescibacteria group bacterium]|nr:50S ribosome-binding GTPase [Patescibacteria group bacterium]